MANTEKIQKHALTDRPASQRKIAGILAAARVEFFANGFSAATIEAIAARAQVSKVTIYSWFKDKENLFAQVVRTESSQLRENFLLENLAEQNLHEILLHAARGMLDFLMREDRVRMERILGAEVTRDPAIGKMFLENGPLRMAEGLKALLQASVEKGEIQSDDLEASAEMFAGLVMGRMDLLLRYGHKIKMTAADKEKRARRAVDAWMLIHQV